MFVSVAVMSVVSSLAYLSGGLVWHILAYLFRYWVADLSWFVMTGRGSWDDLWDWYAVCFWDWYTFWYLDLSWDLDWHIPAYTLNFDMAQWCSYSNWGWTDNTGTKTRQKKLSSLSCFGISFGFRVWFRFRCTLSNNVCSSKRGTSNSESSRGGKCSST